VSGAGEGLGRAVCVKLAEHGAKIVVGDIDEAAVESTMQAVHAIGGRATGRATDIRDPRSCQSLVELACTAYGGVDVLVNDAYDGGDFQPFEVADLERWRATADVNLWGSLQMTRAALDALKRSSSGRVIMICTHGVQLIQPRFGAYTASKAALAHLTKLLACELGEYGIRVNGVFPGPILGRALLGHLQHLADTGASSLDEVKREFAAHNALKYLVPADEIAGSVVFLSSDLSLPVTGQALYVNAGEVFH